MPVSWLCLLTQIVVPASLLRPALPTVGTIRASPAPLRWREATAATGSEEAGGPLASVGPSGCVSACAPLVGLETRHHLKL